MLWGEVRVQFVKICHDLQTWFELKIFSFSLSFHFCIVVLVTIVCVDASENSFSTGSWSASREGSRR